MQVDDRVQTDGRRTGRARPSGTPSVSPDRVAPRPAMTVQTITADSIQAALAEARRRLGDDVVLLESQPARDGQPARVTVMVDLAGARRSARETAPAAAPLGYGYAAARGPRSETAEESAAPAGATRSAAPRRPVFTPPPAAGPSLSERDVEAAVARVLERHLAEALPPLAERLERLERALAQTSGLTGPLLAAIQRWSAHPLFGKLLRTGMRPETASGLFADLVAHGFRPDDPDPARQEAMAWALAQALRERLAATAPVRLSGTQLFVGPSGAGKTSLLLKLAQHPSFFGRRRVGVLAIGPERPEELLWRDPSELYRRFGLPVQTVSTPEEVDAALARFEHLDQLMVDTPPLPRRPAAAAAVLQRVRALLEPIVPLDVTFVLDATRSPETYARTYLDTLPLRPNALALTHLDEVPGWGRLADCLLALGMPVQVVSVGTTIPDDLLPYAPAWFAEELARRLGAHPEA